MPITVTITAEPSGAVVARGGDSLAKSLLNHAGFAYANDWHGPRHRLPTSMSREEQSAVATHAADMLRAARYAVDLDPVLDVSAETPAKASPTIGDQLLDLTDRIRATTTADGLAREVGPLATPDTGVLDRLTEALSAAEEQLGDLDPLGTAHELGDRLGVAWEHVGAAQSVLIGIDGYLRHVGGPGRSQEKARAAAASSPRQVAVATSPSAARASASGSTSPAAPTAAPPAGPVRDSGSRTR